MLKLALIILTTPLVTLGCKMFQSQSSTQGVPEKVSEVVYNEDEAAQQLQESLQKRQTEFNGAISSFMADPQNKNIGDIPQDLIALEIYRHIGNTLDLQLKDKLADYDKWWWAQGDGKNAKKAALFTVYSGVSMVATPVFSILAAGYGTIFFANAALSAIGGFGFWTVKNLKAPFVIIPGMLKRLASTPETAVALRSTVTSTLARMAGSIAAETAAIGAIAWSYVVLDREFSTAKISNELSVLLEKENDTMIKTRQKFTKLSRSELQRLHGLFENLKAIAEYDDKNFTKPISVNEIELALNRAQ